MIVDCVNGFYGVRPVRYRPWLCLASVYSKPTAAVAVNVSDVQPNTDISVHKTWD